MRVTVPQLSTSSALSFCQSLQGLDYDEMYYFDVSKTSNYEPLPMLLTAAAIRQFCSERLLSPQQIQLIFKDDANYQYACHMGFFRSAGFAQGKAPGEASGSSTYIPLTQYDIAEMTRESFMAGHAVDQGDIIEREAKRLSTVLAQGQTEFQQLLQYILREAILSKSASGAVIDLQ